MNLDQLGFTKEELQQRVVDQCVEQVMAGVAYDECGDPYDGPSSIMRKMREEVQKQIADAVAKMGSESILPLLTERIESLVLQETTTWGEKKGEPVSFTDYLIQRAEAYMQEEVDWHGKSKNECSSYDRSYWRAAGRRLAVAIHNHLTIQVESAMKKILLDGNKGLVEALHETCKIKLNEIADSLKVTVAAK